jgi:hypothetical protein
MYDCCFVLFPPPLSGRSYQASYHLIRGRKRSLKCSAIVSQLIRLRLQNFGGFLIGFLGSPPGAVFSGLSGVFSASSSPLRVKT